MKLFEKKYQRWGLFVSTIFAIYIACLLSITGHYVAGLEFGLGLFVIINVLFQIIPPFMEWVDSGE